MNLIEARKNTLASRIMNAQEATETTTDATTPTTTDATTPTTTDATTPTTTDATTPTTTDATTPTTTDATTPATTDATKTATTDATTPATTDATKTATTDVNTKPEESSSSGTVWIILGVVVVIGLGIGGYFYTKNKAAQKEGGESDDRKLYKDQVV